MLKLLADDNEISRADMTTATSTSQSRETKLLEKLRSGDRAATEQFYHLYRNRLYSLVLEQVGLEQAVAEDLVQEVFLAALGSLDKFRGDCQLYTWLRSIALHKINDFYRSQAREPKAGEWLDDSGIPRVEQIADNQPAHSTQMESEEITESVHQALAELPRDYQQVLVLKYLKDMPVLAISEVMGRSPKSVEALLTRARKAMRANLGNGSHYESH
jgi:RNA polymerase sigma-70 factor, ECF subfamily